MADTLSTDQNINPETLVQVVALNNVMKVDVHTYVPNSFIARHVTSPKKVVEYFCNLLVVLLA